MTGLDRRTKLAAFAVTYLAAGGVGFWLAPRELLDTEVKHTGLFTVDTKRILSATVQSLRSENKLMVLTFKGSASVEVEHDVLWLFSGYQKLIVPGTASYYVDLSRLSLANVTYDERAKLVRVKLPKLVMGDVALEPEHATTITAGVLTFSEAQIEALRTTNFASARRAIIAQAQQPGLVDAAERQATANIEAYFAVPLTVAGLPDVKVAATFH
jgi:hypothetical protein